ncbi:MAG: flagellar biosynthesis regulator FlaF [Desulfobacterales bacterium]|nr:flagellar biosynthesis regulator FlaF [Desulfobacterales bacterium]
MSTNPMEAYESVNKSTMSGREIEAAVLTKAARKLKVCQDNWDADDRHANLDIALKFNQRIWSIFQSELAREDNPLPRKLKVDLLSLSTFIDRRIFEIIANPSPEKLTIVININNNIAAGLRRRPSTDGLPESYGG